MNKHDEIKSLIKASRKLLSNEDTIQESYDILKQYRLLNEQSSFGDITKKLDIAGDIEKEMDDDDAEFTKTPRDVKQAFRISGIVIVFNGKDESEIQITEDELKAVQQTVNEFIQEVSSLVKFNQLNVYSSDSVEWSGTLKEYNLDFIFVVGKENGMYIRGDMINTDEDFLDLISNLKNYYQKFKEKWSTVLNNRELTKTKK